MKKSALLFILSIVYTAISFGQIANKKGYIIQQNDTIHGYVDLKSNEQNTIECLFSKTADGNFEAYGTDKITGYGVGKYDYVKKTLDTKNVQGEFFLEVIVNANVSLYYASINKTEGRETEFFIEKEGVIYELTKQKELVTLSEGKIVEKVTKTYVGVLQYLFNDCKKLAKEINSTSYKYESFVEIVTKYNNCKGDDVSIQTKEKTKMYGVVVGVLNSNLNVNQGLSYQSESNFEPSINMNFGAFYETYFRSSRNKLSLRLGLNYLHEKFNGQADTSPNNIGMNHHDMEVKVSFVRLPILLTYNFPVIKTHLNSVFIGAGLTNSLLIGHTDSRKVTTSVGSGNVVSTSEGVTFEGYRTLDYSLTARFGTILKFNNLTLIPEVRYENTIGGLSNDNAVARVSRVSFNIGVGI